MSRFLTGFRRLFCVGLLALAAASSNSDRTHGDVPPDTDLDQLIVGVDTRESLTE